MNPKQLLNTSALALILACAQSNLASAQTEPPAPATQAGAGEAVPQKADGKKQKLSKEEKAERRAARKAAKAEEKDKVKGSTEQKTPPAQEPAQKPSAETAPQKAKAPETSKPQSVAAEKKQKAKPKADAAPAPADVNTKSSVETAPAAPAAPASKKTAAPKEPTPKAAEKTPEKPKPSEAVAAPATPAAPASKKIAAPKEPAPKAAEKPAETPKSSETIAAPTEPSPPSIVKDQLNAAEKEKLAGAERRRRREKKKHRNELIGAAAAGVVIGAIIQEMGGKVVADEGDLIIVERDGRRFVRKDENERLRGDGANVSTEQLPEGRQRTRVVRPNGVEIITVRDSGGYIIRRVKLLPNGDRIVLIDNRDNPPTRHRKFRDELPPMQLGIARRDYVVESGRADRRQIRETLIAQPVENVERAYTLSEIRDSERLRAKVRRVDLDTITFDTGSSSLTQSQVSSLEDIGGTIATIIEENPREMFLIEGHTDAVGSDVSNLTLSDRRAETIARILSDNFEVPPENMVVQGYGEQYLKVQTETGQRENRRVTVRRITALLNRS